MVRHGRSIFHLTLSIFVGFASHAMAENGFAVKNGNHLIVEPGYELKMGADGEVFIRHGGAIVGQKKCACVSGESKCTPILTGPNEMVCIGCAECAFK